MKIHSTRLVTDPNPQEITESIDELYEAASKSVDRVAIMDQIKLANLKHWPVGVVYTQYPQKLTDDLLIAFPEEEKPENLFGGTWIEIFDNEDVFMETGGSIYNDTSSIDWKNEVDELINKRKNGLERDYQRPVSGLSTYNIKSSSGKCQPAFFNQKNTNNENYMTQDDWNTFTGLLLGFLESLSMGVMAQAEFLDSMNEVLAGQEQRDFITKALAILAVYAGALATLAAAFHAINTAFSGGFILASGPAPVGGVTVPGNPPTIGDWMNIPTPIGQASVATIGAIIVGFSLACATYTDAQIVSLGALIVAFGVLLGALAGAYATENAAYIAHKIDYSVTLGLLAEEGLAAIWQGQMFSFRGTMHISDIGLNSSFVVHTSAEENRDRNIKAIAWKRIQ
jgi:hypothetical protein